MKPIIAETIAHGLICGAKSIVEWANKVIYCVNFKLLLQHAVTLTYAVDTLDSNRIKPKSIANNNGSMFVLDNVCKINKLQMPLTTRFNYF